MATKTAEFSIEEKLSAVLTLQKIDSKLDALQTHKGELPMEVSDLEDEVEGLQTRISNIGIDIEKMQEYVATRLQNKKDSEALIVRYEEQQENVKNSREFEALTKEIEMQGLDMKLADKNIKDTELDLQERKELKLENEKMIAAKKDILEQKKEELERIIKETEKEEAALQKDSEKAKAKVEGRFLTAYERIRSNYRNGLAVVPVVRDSCGGCFNIIPPQRQAEIQQRKKIIVCEHCGRILVDNELYEHINP